MTSNSKKTSINHSRVPPTAFERVISSSVNQTTTRSPGEQTYHQAIALSSSPIAEESTEEFDFGVAGKGLHAPNSPSMIELQHFKNSNESQTKETESTSSHTDNRSNEEEKQPKGDPSSSTPESGSAEKEQTEEKDPSHSHEEQSETEQEPVLGSPRRREEHDSGVNLMTHVQQQSMAIVAMLENAGDVFSDDDDDDDDDESGDDSSSSSGSVQGHVYISMPHDHGENENEKRHEQGNVSLALDEGMIEDVLNVQDEGDDAFVE